MRSPRFRVISRAELRPLCLTFVSTIPRPDCTIPTIIRLERQGEMYDITISPAQLEDLPELARIYLHAFRPSPVMSKVLRPAALHRDDLTDQDRIRLTAQSLRRDYIDGKGAEQHVFLKAVRDGKVVGYAIWGKPELAKLDRPERDAGEEPSELNPEEDAQAIARLIVEIEQKRAVLMGDRPHWYVTLVRLSVQSDAE